MTMPDTEEQSRAGAGAAHTHTHTKGALSAAAKRLKTLLSTWHKNAVPNPQQEQQQEQPA